MRYKIFAVSILSIILATCVSDNVLVKIKKYKCASFPVDTNAYIQEELYDFSLNNNYKVPSTLYDVFIHDIFDVICDDIIRTVVAPKPMDVCEKDVLAALNIFLERDWTEFAGYRPWTHWNFIKSLTPFQREILASEIVEYIAENGIKEVINEYRLGLPPRNDEYYAKKSNDYNIKINKELWKTEPINKHPLLDSLYLEDGNLYIHFISNYKHDLLTVKKNGALYGRYDLTTEWSTELAGILMIEDFDKIKTIALSINNGQEALLTFDTLNQVNIRYSDTLLYIGYRKHVRCYF